MGAAPLATPHRIVRCPTCGSERLQLRTAPDRIDRLQQTPVDRVKRLFVAEMQLYHCRVCRLQFYDTAQAAPPPMQQAAQPVRESTLVGPTMTIKGRITSREDMLVHGEIEGDLAMPGRHLTISTTGRVYGDVQAAGVEIRGTLEGNVDARQSFVLRASAGMTGSIRTPSLAIEAGAFCQGRIETV